MITVVYASQTGTAQYYAQQCVKDLWSRGVSIRFIDIQHLSVDGLVRMEGLVLFVVATSGQGQMTESATPFWRSLLSTLLPVDVLKNCKYSILGLGDSSYQHFNYAAKKLHRRLEQLGGVQVIERQFADEQSSQGIDDGYGVWMKSIRDYLECGEICRTGYMYKLDYNHNEPCMIFTNAIVLNSVRMTPSDYEKDVRLVSIQSDNLPELRPGDVALFHPHSQDDDVLLLCKRLAIDPNMNCKFVANRPDAPLAELIVSVKDLLKYHLDIYSPLTRNSLSTLSLWCTEDQSKEKLLEMALTDYDLYLEYIVRPKRTPLEVLNDFECISGVPLEAFFDIFPLIRPRSFSIASYYGNNSIDLCAAIVRFKSPFLKPTVDDREGLASRCLVRLKPGERVRVECKSGDISSVQFEQWKSVVLIGAGTGVAPLRSIVHFYTEHDISAQIDIYYGCRSVEKDCLFYKEFEENSRVRFNALGSRDEPGPRRHLDVLLQSHQQEITAKLLDPSVLFILSGNNNLPQLLKSCIDRFVNRPGFADFMQRSNRLVIECWP